MRARSLFLHLVIGFAVVAGLLGSVTAEPIKVGPYLVNTEGILSGATPRYVIPLNLGKVTRLVVQIAPQYAIDFGIIPAADLKKWRTGKGARYHFRLSGETDTRYITLKAGAYYVVARDLNGGVVANGFAVKIRKFTGLAKEEDAVRYFVNSRKESLPVPPNSWNGFAFQVPAKGDLWFDGIFSRGSERRVRWEILSEPEYRKFASGYPHKALLAGSNPATLGFNIEAVSGQYFFVLINSGRTYSAYTVVRELYR